MPKLQFFCFFGKSFLYLRQTEQIAANDNFIFKTERTNGGVTNRLKSFLQYLIYMMQLTIIREFRKFGRFVLAGEDK